MLPPITCASTHSTPDLPEQGCSVRPQPEDEAYPTTNPYLDQLTVSSTGRGHVAQYQERRTRHWREAKHARSGEVAIGDSYSLVARFLARKLA